MAATTTVKLNNGLEVPVLGLGTWKSPKSKLKHWFLVIIIFVQTFSDWLCFDLTLDLNLLFTSWSSFQIKCTKRWNMLSKRWAIVTLTELSCMATNMRWALHSKSWFLLVWSSVKSCLSPRKCGTHSIPRNECWKTLSRPLKTCSLITWTCTWFTGRWVS